MNYEKYLIEILNGSLKYFALKRLPNEEFRLQSIQSNGEDDAVSSIYSIDFKLLVRQDYMAAMSKNKPYVDTSMIKYGFIIANNTRKTRTPVPSNNIIFDIMKYKTVNDLKLTENESVIRIMGNLKKEKNLFIYYPYEFVSKQDLPESVGGRILNVTLGVIMQYRETEQPQKDTFICFKSNEYFLIYEWKDGGFIFRDRVHEAMCANYLGVKELSIY